MIDVSPEDVQKEIDQKAKDRSYLDAVKNGIIIGIILYLIQSFVVFLLIIITGKTVLYFSLYNSMLIYEGALLFMLSGTAIWFIPSPSWTRLKSSLFNKPFILRTTTDAMKVGTQRFFIGLMMLVFVEIHGIIINLIL
jgi:hypothetical protein